MRFTAALVLAVVVVASVALEPTLATSTPKNGNGQSAGGNKKKGATPGGGSGNAKPKPEAPVPSPTPPTPEPAPTDDATKAHIDAAAAASAAFDKAFEGHLADVDRMLGEVRATAAQAHDRHRAVLDGHRDLHVKTDAKLGSALDAATTHGNVDEHGLSATLDGLHERSKKHSAGLAAEVETAHETLRRARVFADDKQRPKESDAFKHPGSDRLAELMKQAADL